MTAPLLVVDLGERGYSDTHALQRAIAEERIAGTLDRDVLLLVQHEPTVTLGRGTRSTSLPIAPDLLVRRGITVAEVERGGDVTWHGPGQLVGYPILDLQQHKPDLHWYLRQLEEVLIRALDRLRVPAERRPGLTGVWTRGRKIASLGVHVRRWVTTHGFALNVVNDLTDFSLIVPCGIEGVQMTSLATELTRVDELPGGPLWNQATQAVVTAFGEVFERVPEVAPLEALPLGTAGTGPA